MLGTFDVNEYKTRQERNNSVIINLLKKKYNVSDEAREIDAKVMSADEAKLPEHISNVLKEIKNQDTQFDFDKFMSSVRKAYIMYMKAIQDNDLETLKNLLDSDLLTQKNSLTNILIEKIDSIEMTHAVVYGDRAEITVKIVGDTQFQFITFSRYISQEKIWKIIKIS